MVTLMTALWFAHLQAPDRVSVKPHASPGAARDQLPARRARPAPTSTTLREFGGLQSYPSPHEGPRPRRLLDRLGRHRGHRPDLGRDRAPLPGRSRRGAVGGRAVALLGDAELDEGASGRPWPTRGRRASASCCGSSTSTASPWTGSCPTSQPAGWRACSTAAGWQVVTVKYGRLLGAVRPPGGEELRRRSRTCRNEEYQRMLRVDSAARCATACRGDGADSARCVAELDDATLLRRGPRPRRPRPRRAARGLPRRSTTPTARPWSSPTRSRAAGCRPRATRSNHSALLTEAADRRARRRAPAPTPDDPWRRSPPGSAEAELCRRGRAPARARRSPAARAARRAGRARPQHRKPVSTQQALGRLLRRPRARGARGGRARGDLQPRRGLARPTSAAGSTRPASGRLGERRDWFADDTERSCAGTRTPPASTSSSGSPRSTWSACWASSAPPGRATASR